MNTLWRGLKGAMIGIGIVGFITVMGLGPMLVLAIPPSRCLAFAALTSFFVVGIAEIASHLPQRYVRILKYVLLIVGVALLAGPFVMMAFRNWGMEPPDLSYLLPLLAGLLGSVILLAYEAGVAVQAKVDVDSGKHPRVPERDNRFSKIDRLWLWVTLAAWLLITSLILLPWWYREGGGLDLFFGLLSVCLLWGGFAAFCLIGIPLRIVLNLIFKERRRQRFLETVMCIVAFLTMSWILIAFILTYPPDW
jgi:hypothetical protein